MRKNLGKQQTAYPMPVLIIASYDEDGTPNAMNVASGRCTDNQISVTVSRSHRTTQNITMSGAFTVSFADASHVTECDYIGLVSGNDVKDKIAKAGFTTTRSSFVNAPIINELPICFECTLTGYDCEEGLLVGEIVNISVDEEYMDGDVINMKKAAPLMFVMGDRGYYALTERIGSAFEDGKALMKL